MAAMAESSALTVCNIQFSYGEKLVLSNVSLSAQSGEIVGLIGPNGSGKTTLLRIISGVLQPATGIVQLGDTQLARLSRAQVARRLAVVPQNSALPSNFTVGETVLQGRTPYLGFLRSEGAHDYALARHAMELCGVFAMAERRVDELSGGEQQRVLIARALAQEPDVLLLDEPTSHLDLAHHASVLELVDRLVREQALAVLGVFHDLNLAAQYCDRLVLLDRGQVVAEGTPREVLDPAIIQRVYGSGIRIVEHPDNSLPVVLITKAHHRHNRSH
jgi:iron complex transport system ATP-binding protein